MALQTLTHRTRLETCLSASPIDRAPVALWRHFPVDDQSPGRLAAATVAFQQTYDFDLVKVTPASSYCIRDWGVADEWHGSAEGTRDYTVRVVQHPEDWEKLTPLDPARGSLGAQLECLRLITRELGAETPVIQTIFSPLAQAKNLAGQDRLIVHLRRAPQAVEAGLQVITESTRRFIETARQTGIAGIFYAVQHAQFGLLSLEEYEQFGRKYDLQVLEAAKDLWLNMLHLHGTEVMFDRFLDYPVSVINWHDKETAPHLGEAQKMFHGAVCGGLRRWETMALGDPASVEKEAKQALQVTGGRRFILGTGCVLPVVTPHGNILAARRSVERL